jgi:hypothetical protein
MTDFTGDGLQIDAIDLSAINPKSGDHDRMFHHDGSSSINMTGGGSTTQRGYYVWDSDEGAWHGLFHNADKLDGMESGDFIHRDGALAMLENLDIGHNSLVNTDSVESGVGKLSLNSNHVSLKALSGGANVQLEDSNGLLLLNAQESGDVDIPNGQLSEQGSRVATRTWVNTSADVSNADYADDAGMVDGKEASAFIHADGDQMEGSLDLGGFDLTDSGSQIYNSTAGEFVQSTLAGPASSLTSYPLPAGDLAEDYVLTSRLPLPAGDLAEDYALTSRFPLPATDLAEDYALTSRFPIPNSDLSNSTVTVNAGNQLTGGGSVGLGGTITVDVDENALDADTLDGAHKSDLDSQFVDVGGDTMSGVLTVGDGSFDTPLEVEGPTGNSGAASFILTGGRPSFSMTNDSYGHFVELNENGLMKFQKRSGSGGFDYDWLVFDHGDDTVDFQNVNLQESGNRVATRTWTDNNADVPNADYADNAGDSDTLDGEHASAFADAGHLHDGRYILEGGDTMSGVLTLSDGSTAASQSWVNGNADVPNADYADSAGDADTLDSLDSSQFLRSDTSDTLNADLSVAGETRVQFGGSNYFARYDSGRDVLVIGSSENGEVMEVDNAGNLRIEGSLTEGATIGN